MAKIHVLTGSTRPGRFNIQPAAWIFDIARKTDGIDATLVDLADINLPFLDEAVPAAQQKYANEHTKQWAAMIGEADGFVFVTPEYNHSYSAVLKNAIDYLAAEWHYKPVAFVSYGSLAGGSRAVEHLRCVAGELNMFDIREQIMFPNYWEQLDANGVYQFTERYEKSAQGMLQVLAYWATAMKTARAAMQ